MWLNCVMEKSAARLACFPSLPTSPIPTLAACRRGSVGRGTPNIPITPAIPITPSLPPFPAVTCIMLTSLPPSPMAAALLPLCRSISLTTEA